MMSAQTQPSLRRILASIDGSDNSKRAALLAIRLAKNNNAEMIVLSVIPNPIYFGTVAPGPSAPYIDYNAYYEAAEKNASGWIDVIDEMATKEGVKTTRDIVQNSTSTVESIVTSAEKQKVDLIVIGTRGLGGFKRLVLGSVSSGVVSHAHCNVLVVR